ncbi:glycosyltransferase family 4 protein [bacterium]|nr:glycosyltransferase family 4 protein [bacterium]
MKRILMLNYEFPPLGGGAANANYYLLKEFARFKELKVDLITSSTERFKKQKFSPNITIYFLDIGKRRKNLHYQTNKDLIIYSIKSYLLARKLLKKNSYDMIHAWFGIPCGFVAMLLKKPYIVSLRGSDVPFYNPRFYWLDKIIFKHLSKIIWKKSKAVIANSQGLKKLAQKTAPYQKIKVIYNGIDTNEFKPTKNKTMSKKLKILCVARLIERKGIKYLLKALGSLKKKDFILTIIGDGEEKRTLVQLTKELRIDKKVKFLGPVPHSKIARHYQKNDLFILPSLNEGMSNTVLEAMACGLPIITTKVGGAKELIKDNGFIIKPKSVLALVDTIKKYLANPKLLATHGKNSQKKAKQMTWNKAAKSYLKIYQKTWDFLL